MISKATIASSYYPEMQGKLQITCATPYLISPKALRQQYLSPSEAEGAIQKVIDAQMEHTPPRLLDTTNGHLCDRESQKIAFITSPEYKKLFSFTIKEENSNWNAYKTLCSCSSNTSSYPIGGRRRSHSCMTSEARACTT